MRRLAVFHFILMLFVGVAALQSVRAAEQPLVLGPPDLPLAAVTWDGRELGEADLARRLAQREEEMLAAVREQTDRMAATDAAVRVAEFILARRIEPQLSRELYEQTTGADWAGIAAAMRAADEAMKLADKSLQASGKDADEALLARMESCRAFAELFSAWAAVVTTPTSQPTTTRAAGTPQDRLVEACRGLAPLLDSSDSDRSGAARLWQAAAYRRAGRVDRALQVLPRVTNAPPALPFDFFARMERCRALADRGDFAAALALAIRIEGQVDEWFPLPQRPSARTTARFLQQQLWQRWNARLEADKDPAAELIRRQTTRPVAPTSGPSAAPTSAPSAGLFRLGIAIGGVDVPLAPPREPARLLEIACDESRVALVLAPGGASAEAWIEARRHVFSFLRGLRGDQSFVVIAAGSDGLVAFPQDANAAAPDQAPAAGDFVNRLRPSRESSINWGDAIARALTCGPKVVFVIAAREPDAEAIADISHRIGHASAKLHVVWLGEPGGGVALQELSSKLGGEFRQASAAPTTQEDEVEPEEHAP